MKFTKLPKSRASYTSFLRALSIIFDNKSTPSSEVLIVRNVTLDGPVLQPKSRTLGIGTERIVPFIYNYYICSSPNYLWYLLFLIFHTFLKNSTFSLLIKDINSFDGLPVRLSVNILKFQVTFMLSG